MDSNLVSLLDSYVQEQGLANRSEALRTLVRRELIESDLDHNYSTRSTSGKLLDPLKKLSGSDNCDHGSGIISLLYPRGLKLQRVPIDPFPSLKIISNLKLHLSEETLLSILVVQGLQKEILDWIRGFNKQKGVLSDYSLFSQPRISEVFHPRDSNP